MSMALGGFIVLAVTIGVAVLVVRKHNKKK